MPDIWVSIWPITVTCSKVGTLSTLVSSAAKAKDGEDARSRMKRFVKGLENTCPPKIKIKPIVDLMYKISRAFLKKQRNNVNVKRINAEYDCPKGFCCLASFSSLVNF